MTSPDVSRRLDEIQARAEDPDLTGGPWDVITDVDELGGGEFPYAIHTPAHDQWNIAASPESDVCDRAKPDDYFHHQRSEVVNFTMADVHLMAHSRQDVTDLTAAVQVIYSHCSGLIARFEDFGALSDYQRGSADLASFVVRVITEKLGEK